MRLTKTDFSFRAILLLLLSLTLAACGGGGGGTSVITLSGTISMAAGTVTDSDVNDPAVRYVSNDTISNAQQVPNPVVIGGFASAVGSGEPGSTFEFTGDKSDYYAITLTAGQVITLNIAENVNLDLYLVDQGNNVIASSMGSTATESLTVPASVTTPTLLYLQVFAVSGASNYTLTVSQAGAAAASLPGQLRLQDEFVPGEVLVQFRDSGMSAMDSVPLRAQSLGMKMAANTPGKYALLRMGDTNQVGQSLQQLGFREHPKAATAELQQKLDTLLMVEALSQSPDVVQVQPNYIYHALQIPDDPLYGRQWNYPLINLPQAWDTTVGSSSVIVAVIDTGILASHPDFSGKLVQGYDFIDNDNNPEDPGTGVIGNSSFHGTHVAGTIAAATNNATGVAGIGWNARIMPLRILDRSGGTSSDLIQAIQYAAGLSNSSGTLPTQPANIINMSLGGLSVGDTLVQDAITDARDNHGIILVAAAGNDANNVPVYPAAFDGVVSVSAVTINKTLAPYSSFGSTIDVAAPGGDATTDQDGDGYPDAILSTIGTETQSGLVYTYGFSQGTSMSSPHVAGVIALMKSEYPAMTPNEFDTLLQSGLITDDIGVAGRDDSFGHGMIDAYKAVDQAIQLAGGAALPDNPVLVATPQSLNFGTSATTATLNLRNGGSGALSVSSISDDSGGWLAITCPSGDCTALGNYSVTVDRGSLADNTYAATITIVSTTNTITIPVIMQVSSVTNTGTTGVLYIFLLDADTGTLVDGRVLVQSGDVFNYSFVDVAPGSYNIVAGTDIDNDFFVCDAGEACGAYPILDFANLTPIEVTGSISGLDFTVSYSSVVASSASVNNTAPPAALHLRRQQTGRVLVQP